VRFGPAQVSEYRDLWHPLLSDRLAVFSEAR
jgi:hypothetical protein